MTRKEVKTSSGFVFEIRRLNALDWLEEGSLPSILVSPDGLSEFAKNPDVKTLREFYAFCMTKAIISIRDGTGIRKKVVKKAPFDCQENEVSWEEIPDPDATEIFNAIIEYSRLTPAEGDRIKEAGKKNNND